MPLPGLSHDNAGRSASVIGSAEKAKLFLLRGLGTIAIRGRFQRRAHTFRRGRVDRYFAKFYHHGGIKFLFGPKPGGKLGILRERVQRFAKDRIARVIRPFPIGSEDDFDARLIQLACPWRRELAGSRGV